MLPAQSKAHFLLAAHAPPDESTRRIYTQLSSDPSSALFLMDDPALAALTVPDAIAFLQAFLAASPLPTATPSFGHSDIAARTRLVKYHTPIRLLAWRIDRPNRMILYMGTACPPPSRLDPADMQPHTFPKAILDDRTRRPQPSVIQQLPSQAATLPEDQPDNVRSSLAAYAKHRLTPFFERIAVLKHPANTTRPVPVAFQPASHTLEEAFACFLHPLPPGSSHHTVVPVNGARQWDKAHIDPRSVLCLWLSVSSLFTLTQTYT